MTTVDKGKEGRIPRTRTSSHPLRAYVLSPDLRVREIRHILGAVGEAVGLVVPDFRKGAMFSEYRGGVQCVEETCTSTRWAAFWHQIDTPEVTSRGSARVVVVWVKLGWASV